MFEPDRFSDANPKWLLIDERSSVPSGLIELVKKEYSSFLGKIKGIYGSSALELNSKNFLVVGEKEKVVVKLCSELTEENFKRQVEIYDIITSKNLPSVKIVGHFFKPFDQAGHLPPSLSQIDKSSAGLYSLVVVNSTGEAWHYFRINVTGDH